MYGKEYLDSCDAATARERIRLAIDEALRGVEDGYTRDRVRAEFTPGGNVQQFTMLQNQAANLQQSAMYSSPGVSLFNRMFG